MSTRVQTCDICMQALLLQAVADNAVGQAQSQIALYVAAPKDENMTGNRQVLHVVDQRMLPGEDVSFPMVRPPHCALKHE